jgi:hypothetical protein
MPTSPLESPAPGFPRDDLHQRKLSRLLPDLNRILLSLPLEKSPYGEVYRLRRPVLVDDLRSPQFACESDRSAA